MATDTPITVEVHMQTITEENWKVRKGLGPEGALVGEFKIPTTATSWDFLKELEALAGPRRDSDVDWQINSTLSKPFTNFKFKGFDTEEGLKQEVGEYMGMKYNPAKPVYLTLKKDMREAKNAKTEAEVEVSKTDEQVAAAA